MRAQTATLLLGPLAALAAWSAMLAGGAAPAAAVTLGVTVLCVLWWVFEPVPLPVTALVPLAVLPMFGVLSGPEVGQAYGHHVVLLLLGGFILSTAMERSGAHLRIAMGLVRAVGGGSSRRVVFGFMIASAALSMWISNTATTLMLLPVALAVLERTKDPKLAPALLLGIAYAANIGGVGTPIGTPPNMVFRGIYEETFGASIGFAEWMALGVPVVLVFLPLMALWPDALDQLSWRAGTAGTGGVARGRKTRSRDVRPDRACLDHPPGTHGRLDGAVRPALHQRRHGGLPGGRRHVHRSERQGRAPARLGDRGEDSLGHADPVRRRARHSNGIQDVRAVGVDRQLGLDDLRLADHLPSSSPFAWP